MECYTITDLAILLNAHYGATLNNIQKKRFLRKGEKSQIFLTIIKNLYDKYSEIFCYRNNYIGFKNFKRDVVKARIALKKAKRITKVKQGKKINKNIELQYELWKVDTLGTISPNY